jgi:hypothetical protein
VWPAWGALAREAFARLGAESTISRPGWGFSVPASRILRRPLGGPVYVGTSFLKKSQARADGQGFKSGVHEPMSRQVLPALLE